MWKEKILEDLEKELQEYRTVEGFLEDIKKKFRKNGKKEKKQSDRIEEDIWGGLEKFCDKKENQRNELPKKQTARKTNRSEF